jgi:branched-chain amino acid transport system permease protein
MTEIRNQQGGLPWRDAFFGSIRAFILSVAIVGMRTTSDETGVLWIDYKPWDVVTIVATVFVVRLLLPSARGAHSLLVGLAALVSVFAIIGYARHFGEIQFATFLVAGLVLSVAGFASVAAANERMRTLLTPASQPVTAGALARRASRNRGLVLLGLAAAVLFPFLPFADRYWLDLAILILTYLVLGWGLNIVVGLAGLLDLGFFCRLPAWISGVAAARRLLRHRHAGLRRNHPHRAAELVGNVGRAGWADRRSASVLLRHRGI